MEATARWRSAPGPHPPTLHRALPPVSHSFKHKPDPLTVPPNTFRDSHQLKNKLELYFMTIKAPYNLVPAPFQWQFSRVLFIQNAIFFLSKIFSFTLTFSTKQIPTHFHRFKYHLIFTTFSWLTFSILNQESLMYWFFDSFNIIIFVFFSLIHFHLICGKCLCAMYYFRYWKKRDDYQTCCSLILFR